MPESVGTFDKLYLSSGTTDAAYTALEFLPGSSLGLAETFLDPSGIRGVRGRQSERVRRGTRQVQGTLLFNPTPAELDLLLPWIMGAAKAVNDVALAETVPNRFLRTGRDGVFHVYSDCKAAQAVFSCAEGSLLQVAVSVVGKDEATTTDPTGSIADDAPYVMMDATATVGGAAYAFRSMQLSIDNGLETRFNNSTTPSSIHATDRTVGVQLGLPYGDAAALYNSALAGVAVVLAFTNGTKSLTATMPAVQSPRQPLELGNRAARTLNWSGVARRSGSTQELIFANDSL